VICDILSALVAIRGRHPPPLVAGRAYGGGELDGTKAPQDGLPPNGGAFAETVAGRPNCLVWPVPAHWTSQEGAAFPVNLHSVVLAYWKLGLAGKSSADPFLAVSFSR